MRKTIIFSVILLTTLGIFASSSAVILEENITYTINNDGLVKKHVYQKVKLNNHVAFRYFGEWFYTYNPNLQKITIIKSRTTQTNGNTVDTQGNGMLVMSPYATKDAPDFSYMREYMVSHIGLEPGCIVEFEYEIEDLKPHQLFVFEQMGGDFPILKKTVVVDGDYLNEFHTKGVKKNGNKFFVSNTQTFKGTHFFANKADVPYVFVVFKNGLDVIKDQFKANEQDNLNKALELLHLTKDSLQVQVIETLRDFCNNKLVTVHVDLPKTGYGRRSLVDIVQSGYATDFEKICLMSIVLSNFGIENSPFYTVDKPLTVLLDPDFGVVVKFNGENNLLFPERASFWGKKIVSLFGDEFNYKKEANLSASLELFENETGSFSGNLILEGLNLSGELKGKAGSVLKGIKLKNEKKTITGANYQVVKADVIFSPDKEYITIGNKLINYLHLNYLFNSIASSDFANIRDKMTFKTNFKLHFREPVNCVFTKDFIVENSAGSSFWNWTYKDKVLQLNASLVLNKNVLSSNEMCLIKELLAPLFDLNNKVVFINKR